MGVISFQERGFCIFAFAPIRPGLPANGNFSVAANPHGGYPAGRLAALPGDYFYPPTRPFSGIPLSLRDIPLRGTGGKLLLLLLAMPQLESPHSANLGRSVCGSEPPYGGGPAGPGEPLWVEGCAAERCLRQMQRGGAGANTATASCGRNRELCLAQRSGFCKHPPRCEAKIG